MISLNHLQQLEAETTHIMPEVAASFERPCLFYSIGKDSTVMSYPACKGFASSKDLFTWLPIDTTWEFADKASLHDRLVEQEGHF